MHLFRIGLALLVGIIGLLFILIVTPSRSQSQQGEEAPPLQANKFLIKKFERPLLVTKEKGSSLTVLEQTGKIKVKRNNKWQTALNLSKKVGSGNEQGLLGFVYHPNYKKNGFAFVNYTNKQGNTRISRFKKRDKGFKFKPSSEKVLMRIKQPYKNHNGGTLQFGQNALFISLGDGGGPGDPDRRAQNKQTRLGKILRIVPDKSKRGYHNPRSNPYFGKKKGLDSILARGLRNPWRISLDKGYLYIGDVGQSAYEEINRIQLSQVKNKQDINFGWSAFEGPDRFNSDEVAPNAKDPQYAYPHPKGCSVIAGFYGEDFGQEGYVFSDYCDGYLQLLEGSEARQIDLRVPRISSLSKVEGTIYATSTEGQVYRISPIVARTPQVQVIEREFQIFLSRNTVPQGEVTVETINRGEDPHDLFLQKGDTVYQVPVLQPGEMSETTVNLDAGVWTVYCGIEGHRPAGMETTLVVE